MSGLYLCNTCACAELRKQERARKLCSATLNTQFSRAILLVRFSARTKIAKTNMPAIQRSFYLLEARFIFAIFLRY